MLTVSVVYLFVLEFGELDLIESYELSLRCLIDLVS